MANISWIKLKTDMFDDEKIKLIERMPEGDMILIVWIKLLTYAGKANCDGYIMIAEDIPMNIEEMAVIFNRPLEKVRYAIQVLQRYKMLEVDENDRVYISNWEKHQNIDGMERVRKLNAERNKKYRERKKQISLQTPKDVPIQQNDVSVTSRDGTDIDLDLDIDKEIDKETDKDKQQVVSQLVSQSFAKLVDFVNNNIQAVTPFISELLGQILDEYKDVDLILAALQGAITNPKTKNKIKYAEGTLRNWKKELITTYEQLKAKEEREKNKPKLKNGRTEVIPEWFNKRNQQSVQPNSQSSDEVIDFKAERQKILAKLEG